MSELFPNSSFDTKDISASPKDNNSNNAVVSKITDFKRVVHVGVDLNKGLVADIE